MQQAVPRSVSVHMPSARQTYKGQYPNINLMSCRRVQHQGAGRLSHRSRHHQQQQMSSPSNNCCSKQGSQELAPQLQLAGLLRCV
jgi:hypothetical protein